MGATLLVACQDSPLAPVAARPALTPSLSERGESRSVKTYTFTTIDVPYAASTAGGGINARGDIVGSYVDVSGRSHGYLLRNGKLTTIDYSATSSSEARGIGPRGEIVGWYRNVGEPVLVLHGFLRTKQGAFVAVNDPPHISTVAQRILPDGTILGCRHELDQMASMRGIVISPKGAITELDAFGSMVNGGTPDHESIVGLYYKMDMGGGAHPEGFVIEEGQFTSLLVPGSTNTQAFDINPAGEIVGFYHLGTEAALVFHGFVRSDERYVTLDFPGAMATRLRGINARGDIVGTYQLADGKNHGFLARVAGDDNR
jgi:uncharacterized membrane protein